MSKTRKDTTPANYWRASNTKLSRDEAETSIADQWGRGEVRRLDRSIGLAKMSRMESRAPLAMVARASAVAAVREETRITFGYRHKEFNSTQF